MAEKIDDVPVYLGRIVRVKNTLKPKFSNANTEYYAIFVEDSDGSNERCLLFTQNEIKMAEYRSMRNQEDLTKRSFLVDLFD